MVQKILRLPDVMAATGLRKTSIYKLVAAGKLPKPIPITEKSRGWLESEIAAFQTSRIAARDGARVA